MFTGLVEERGTLRSVRPLAGGGRRLEVSCRTILDDLKTGDSVALNGVCQTVVDLFPGGAAFEAVGDTLTKTTLGTLLPGAFLNLERACRADSRLGGHLVQGHVQAVARVLVWEARGAGWNLEVSLPPGWEALVVSEGSITVDGISLTVAEVLDSAFRISVIPHTVQATTFAFLGPGQRVNLEADVLARYVQAALGARRPGLDTSQLHQWGYP
jgi:riboflavin synthase